MIRLTSTLNLDVLATPLLFYGMHALKCVTALIGTMRLKLSQWTATPLKENTLVLMPVSLQTMIRLTRGFQKI